MGWRPRDVLECTPREFMLAWDGWLEMHSAPTKNPPTRMEMDEMLRAMRNGK